MTGVAMVTTVMAGSVGSVRCEGWEDGGARLCVWVWVCVCVCVGVCVGEYIMYHVCIILYTSSNQKQGLICRDLHVY